MRGQLTGLKDLIDAVPSITAAQVDAVNMLPAGSPASVAVSVSGGVLHLSFELPQGNDGAQGAPGSNGNDGGPGPQGPPFTNFIDDGVMMLNPADPATVQAGFDGMAVRLSWAEGFLDAWITRALRSRLAPMMKVARMLRSHRELLGNYFRARKLYSSGVVEGLNLKCNLIKRRAYGLRSFKALQTALYHNLGHLLEPESTHRFC